MTDQIPLFCEDLNDAIRQTVQALGGMKRVGADMRPELPADQAGRWLGDCLNPDRRERLDPQQLSWIRRRARQAGVHILAAFEAADAGYAQPQPLEPEDARAALMREFVQATKASAALVRRLEALGVAA